MKLANKKDIAIFINVRKDSRRCRNKLLRPFAGTTLVDILLDKLKNLSDYPIYFAAYDNVFLKRAEKLDNITAIKRSKESVDSDSDAKKVFEALQNIPSEYVAWINPSHSFLSLNTFLSAVRFFENSNFLSLSSAKKKKGWFYLPDGSPINNKNNFEVDTVLSEWIYEIAHSFHIYRKDYMLSHGKPWTNTKNDPALYEITELEAQDIDTEDEFVMIEALYEKIVLNRKD